VRNKRKVTVNLLTVCVQWRASASSTGSSRSELRLKDCLVGHEMETYSWSDLTFGAERLDASLRKLLDKLLNRLTLRLSGRAVIKAVRRGGASGCGGSDGRTKYSEWGLGFAL